MAEFYYLNGRLINLESVEEITKVSRIIPNECIFRDAEKKIWGIIIYYKSGRCTEIFPENADEKEIDRIIQDIFLTKN